jgi:siroheme synthase (precorrin-2 oxidase/ferrochelatase)
MSSHYRAAWLRKIDKHVEKRKKRMEFLKKIWNIITFKDVNLDGKVDIKDKMAKAKAKSTK